MDVLSSVDMGRQKRPTGPMWTVDDAWKRDIRACMDKQGISRAELARRLGVRPASITTLFKPETKQTRLKPGIHKILGLVQPSSTPAVERDGAMARLQRVWPQLSEEEREQVVRNGELFVAGRNNSRR